MRRHGADEYSMNEHVREGEHEGRLVSRREVVGGGLVLGLFALTGCGGAQTRLPNPTWNAAAAVPVYVPPPTPAPVSPAAPVPSAGNLVMMPRSAWTREGVARVKSINPMRGVSRITVHHEGMDAFTATSKESAAERLQRIRSGHLQRTAKSGERWADIGYHYAIDPAGRVWECRSAQYQGAHVQDQNEHNLGVLMLGNFDRQQPTAAATAALDQFVSQQMRRFSVPRSRVYTHRELSPTACPGSSLQTYMVRTRGRGGRLAMMLDDMRLA